jgi:hypothetical protein
MAESDWATASNNLDFSFLNSIKENNNAKDNTIIVVR